MAEWKFWKGAMGDCCWLEAADAWFHPLQQRGGHEREVKKEEQENRLEDEEERAWRERERGE